MKADLGILLLGGHGEQLWYYCPNMKCMALRMKGEKTGEIEDGIDDGKSPD